MASESKHLQKYSSQMETSYDEVSEIEYYDLLDKAVHLISKLPPQQKKVFLLRKEKGLSSEEMAEELKLILDGTKSKSFTGDIVSYDNLHEKVWARYGSISSINAKQEAFYTPETKDKKYF